MNELWKGCHSCHFSQRKNGNPAYNTCFGGDVLCVILMPVAYEDAGNFQQAAGEFM